MQFKEDQWEYLYFYAKTLDDKHVSFNEIEKKLTSKTDDINLINDIMKQLKKVHYAIKTKNGLMKIGFGVLFLISGFIITCFNFHSNQSFSVIMYGFTSIGLVFVFWGLYDIIG